MPDVSVVVPTRDRSALLRVALFTALWQRGVDIEVIVVDDGSTDDTNETVSVLSDRGVRYVRLPVRGGVSEARNRGIQEARGEWIAFLDDDDLWAPDKLSRQLQSVTAAGRTWVYSGDVNVDGSLHVLSASPPPTPEQVMRALPRYNPVPTGASNVVVRADVLAEAGPFDPGLRRTEDWDMWIRLASQGPPAWVPSPLVAYRFHAANIPAELAAVAREPNVLADRYGIPVDRAAVHRRAAWICLRAGHRGLAVRHYARAVALGDFRSVARAAVALVHPAVRSDALFQLARGGRDERWAAEAQAWLDELSDAIADSSLPQ